MARKGKPAADDSPSEDIVSVAAPTGPIVVRNKALVFVSHDSRDSEIAEAFANLLSDVSVGTLKTFRSSDNAGTSGIAFGDEWYAAIVSKLGEASDVVALLTTTSIDRPWILYEAGIAAGRLNTRVIGVAIGIPLSKAVTGPFSQFQNSANDEQSLTKLMLQLLQRNPDAAPRPETVTMHVKAFREKISGILQAKGNGAGNTPPSEGENIAKQVEEIKGLLRDLPDRVGDRASVVVHGDGSKVRRVSPRAMEEIAFGKAFHRFKNGGALAFLAILSVLKDDAPWLYEPGREFYRLATSRSRVGIENAALQMHELIEFSMRGPLREFVDNDETLYRAHRLLHEVIERVVAERAQPMRSSAKE
jgi:hypothetical protein